MWPGERRHEQPGRQQQVGIAGPRVGQPASAVEVKRSSIFGGIWGIAHDVMVGVQATCPICWREKPHIQRTRRRQNEAIRRAAQVCRSAIWRLA